MRLYRYTLALSLLALTGCGISSIYNSEFQCPIPKSDGGCRDLQGVYNKSTFVTPVPPPPDPTRYHSTPSGDKWDPPVKTLWIAPYLDNAGRRHEASLLRIVVFQGPKTIASESEFLLPPIPEDIDGQSTAPPPGPQSSQSARPEATPRNAPSRQPRSSPPTSPLFQPPSSNPTSGFSVPGAGY